LTLEGVSEVSKSHIQAMLGFIRRWIAAFRKQCSERALLKMDRDTQNLVTVQDIRSFKNSSMAREAIKLLASVEKKELQAVSMF